MITKAITYFGQRCVVACDGRCDKAWGINGRPYTQLSKVDDDYVYLGDDVLGAAPGPGETAIIAEGVDAKPSAAPLNDGEQMNRWCVRECERSRIFEVGEPITIRDLRHPAPNMPSRQPSR